MRLSLLVVTCAIVISGCEASTFPELPNDTEMSTVFPELSRPGDVYVEVEPIYSEFYDVATVVSRYVLYDDGTFGLQMMHDRAGFFEYTGRYGISGSTIEFDFDTGNRAGAWEAHGTRAGGVLTVEYNIVAWLADFRPGAYLFSAASP
jgi:hypothetical protein